MAPRQLTVVVKLRDLKELRLMIYSLTQLVHKLRDEESDHAEELENILMRWASAAPRQDQPEGHYQQPD